LRAGRLPSHAATNLIRHFCVENPILDDGFKHGIADLIATADFIDKQILGELQGSVWLSGSSSCQQEYRNRIK